MTVEAAVTPSVTPADAGPARRISELGSPQARVVGKMQLLNQTPQPAKAGDTRSFSDPAVKALNTQGMIDLEAPGQEPQQMVDIEQFEADQAAQQVAEPEQQTSEDQAPPEDEQTQEAAPEADTPEALAAKWRELQDNPEIDMELFGDKVLWYDSDGKGTMMPIRMADVPNNILLYNDYQRKTTEVAERNRALDRKENGMKQWAQDIQSGDPKVGRRAMRAMGGESTMRAMVIDYVNEQAWLERQPQDVQERFLRVQQIEDENFYLKRRDERNAQQQQQMQEQQAQEQGVNAPDIVFVQQAIDRALPEVCQALRISNEEFESDAFQYELGRALVAAVDGKKGADGRWIVAPTIHRGRVPSKSLLQNIVAQTKQRVDKMLASPQAKRLTGPKRKPPPTPSGSGPAPAAGQRGNLSQPQRMRWSDMGKKR